MGGCLITKEEMTIIRLILNMREGQKNSFSIS
jgi:hypothetical protein